MASSSSHHVLRRALIGGYRVSDVEVALASLNLALSQLKLELEGTRRRLVVAEGRVAGEEARLERARRVEVEVAETALRLQRQHEAELRVARDRIAAAEAELAREQEAADALRQTRERPIEVAVPESDPPRAGSLPEVFGPAIELDAGTFGDLASLTRFERSLHALPGVTDVYIRGFAAGRATIDLVLHGPAPLIQEMSERLPYRLDIGATDRTHISLTVEPEALSA